MLWMPYTPSCNRCRYPPPPPGVLCQSMRVALLCHPHHPTCLLFSYSPPPLTHRPSSVRRSVVSRRSTPTDHHTYAIYLLDAIVLSTLPAVHIGPAPLSSNGWMQCHVFTPPPLTHRLSSVRRSVARRRSRRPTSSATCALLQTRTSHSRCDHMSCASDIQTSRDCHETTWE